MVTLAEVNNQGEVAMNALKRRGRDPAKWDRVQYSTFSGADIKCAIFFPPGSLYGENKNALSKSPPPGMKVFAELQTISISSARTVVPVRVLGQARPRGWTRGGRTVAGSLIFTDIMADALTQMLSIWYAERGHTTKYEFFVDQIPPFNVIISAINEAGVYATRSVIGVTLVNYGTTYSIDDLMTESQYTYVAMGVTPFMPHRVWREQVRDALDAPTHYYRFGQAVSALSNHDKASNDNISVEHTPSPPFYWDY